MPLPDERPRQSVANLIGRFENQIQRQPPNTGSPRSASVVSHNTGDLAKEEGKEKHEWPPKSVSSNEKTPSLVGFSFWRQSLGSMTLQEPPASQPGLVDDTASNSLPTSTSSIPDASKIVPLPGQSNMVVSISTPTETSTPTPSITRPSASTTTAPKTPSKAGARSSTNHTPHPIKSQSAGPPNSSTRKPVSKATPSTPATVKIPPRTPVSAPRPKTPAPTSRPKTPSTGLFAPTAASLAKARNAQSQPPTPVKKASLSSSAAERLSKPTAASLSRARTPVPTAALHTKSTFRSSAPRGGAKSRIASPPPVPKPTKAAVAEGADVPLVTEMELSVVNDGTLLGENGYHLESQILQREENRASDGDHTAIDQALMISEAHLTEDTEQVAQLLNATRDAIPDSFGNALQADHVGIKLEYAEARIESQDHGVEVAATKERMDEVKSRVEVGDDLEDMVNLLESVSISRPRPQSIASIPDDVAEIPDEI